MPPLQAPDGPIRHAEHERVRRAANFDLRKFDAVRRAARARFIGGAATGSERSCQDEKGTGDAIAGEAQCRSQSGC